jgi:pimeloyl-ACP methyl ester carboxylesterase
VEDAVGEAHIRHERIRTNGVELHVARSGRGLPVVLLHGFPGFWYSWQRQIGPLASAGFSVWAVDLRGYNLSDKPPGCAAYRLRHLVEDVAGLIRVSGASRAHVVGHDWGGVVAWVLAGVHPELLDRLVILNAPHPKIYLEQVRKPRQMLRSWYVLFFQLPRLPEWLLSAKRFSALRRAFRPPFAKEGAFSEADIERYVEALAKPGALTAAINYYRANYLASLRPDATALAGSAHIDVETLIVWGERDTALVPELLDGIERFAPRVRIHRMPEAGHWVQNEAPDEVNRLLIDFLL